MKPGVLLVVFVVGLVQSGGQADNAGAVPALDKQLKDSDPAVRAQAVEARAKLAMQAGQSCPVGVIEAMLDADAKVREHALNWSGAFPPGRYPQEAAPVLLRCIRSKHAWVRSLGVLLLSQLPKHDERTVEAARGLTHDRETLVRNDAHIAVFRMTGKLDDIVPYTLQYLVERQDAARVHTGKLPPIEQAARNLIALGMAIRMRDLAEERTDELAPYLVKSLTGGHAAIRRAVAVHLAACYRAPDGMFGMSADTFKLTELLTPDAHQGPGAKEAAAAAEKKKRETSAKKQALFRQRLREAGVARQLRQLRDNDPDGLVRGAAAQALLEMEKRHKRDKAP